MNKVIISTMILATASIFGCGNDSPNGVAEPSKAQEDIKEKEVVVYSARKEHLVKPLFDKFTEQTGIKVSYTTDKAEPLLERLKAEGESTPADMLITVDAGNLWHAGNAGVLAKLENKQLLDRVPSAYRSDEDQWVGLSLRARTVVFHSDRVNANEITSYEALADERWKGRLCLRTSKKIYNQSLVAMMIARDGEAAASKVVEGWVANLAQAPLPNDTKVMEAILAGACDVGLVNTYYYGRLLKKEPAHPLALAWPNQSSSGVHVNISGAGITKYAKHPQAAKQLLEWLLSDTAQSVFASLNMEYPVVDGIAVDPVVKGWGDFKADQTPLFNAGKYQQQAVMVMDRAGYN